MAVYICKDRRNSNPFANQLADSMGRYKWKIMAYERDLLFTLVTTDKCTLRCEHCFEESGPENNTFLDISRMERLAEESVDVFANYQKPREIRITGGDPFLHPNLRQIIEAFSSRRDSLGYDTLDIETNGWWASDEGKAEKYVKMAKEAGATLLSMTTDYFHCKQGKFDIYAHFDRMNQAAKGQGLEFRNINTGMCLSDDEGIEREREKHTECCLVIPEVTPIGRGRQLPEKYWEGFHTCNEIGCRLSPPILAKVLGRYVHTDEITVQANGNVYPCNSGKEFEHVTLSLGNIYEKPLTEILATQNPTVRLIREKGLRGLSKAAGIPLRQHWEMYYKLTPCGLCHEILREYGERLAERLA
ncbi:MAG: radical SAM protein [Candidatus Aenigmarchaeota archaeon]|nr:radical SAM protein [Candidatus Aenigmarchaeota archaeon]